MTLNRRRICKIQKFQRIPGPVCNTLNLTLIRVVLNLSGPVGFVLMSQTITLFKWCPWMTGFKQSHQRQAHNFDHMEHMNPFSFFFNHCVLPLTVQKSALNAFMSINLSHYNRQNLCFLRVCLHACRC